VKLFRGAFQTGGEIHAVAQNGELHPLTGTDVADDDFAVVDANADGEALRVFPVTLQGDTVVIDERGP